MFEGIHGFFATNDFMPHGMCYLWRPGVLGLLPFPLPFFWSK
jgi:hypothetical protein